jgi:general stress protein YciG
METKRKQGFATLTRERNREISQLGGKMGQESGRAHRWTSEEAREAGRIGGKTSRRRKPHAPQG